MAQLCLPLQHLTREGLYHCLRPLKDGETVTDLSAAFEAEEQARSLAKQASLYRKRCTINFVSWRKLMGVRVADAAGTVGGSGGRASMRLDTRSAEAERERIQGCTFYPKVWYFKRYKASRFAQM